MRINVDDELAQLAEWAPTPDFMQGACWALSRVSGIPADVLVGRVAVPSATPPTPVPVAPAAPDGPLVDADGNEVLGVYPGIGPITKFADPLVPADMTVPPAPPSADSMAARFADAQAAGDPIALPMDDETLAAVEAELAAARSAAAAGHPIPTS